MARSSSMQINRNERCYEISRRPHQPLRRPREKSDSGSALISKESETFCKSKNNKKEYRPPRLNTSTGAVERAIETLKKLVIAN